MPETKPCPLIPTEGRVVLRIIEQPARHARSGLVRYEVLACGERRDAEGKLRFETEIEVGDAVYARSAYDDLVELDGDVYAVLPYEAVVARIPIERPACDTTARRDGCPF